MSEYPRAAFAVRLSSAIKVRGFISTEETRYYLGGIHVEANPKGGALCVATDGYRLGVANDADGLCHESVIVRFPKIIKAERSFLGEWLVCMLTAPAKGYIAIVPGSQKDGQEDTAQYAVERVGDARLSIGQAVIDYSNYPDWRKVIPIPKEDAPVRRFNRKYLQSFGDYITVIGDGADTPQIVQTGDSQFFGVLMPMRGERKSSPDWL